MEADLSERVRALTARVPAAALAAAAALALVHTFNMLVLDDGLRDLDAEDEANLITWLSTVAAFAAAMGAGLHALLLRERRVLMAAVAAAIAYLSLDDAISLHERLGDKVGISLLHGSEHLASRLQLILISPALAGVLLGGWLLARDAFPEARRAIKLGLVSLVGSIAIEQGLDTLTNRWEATGLEWPDVLRNGIEEAAKLAGWIGLAGGLTALLLCRLLTAAAAGRG
jgi:hypothetical protein